MGEMIYCRRPLAAAPFYIEDVSLNVYSLEELSFYIATNVYLLNQEFMSGELCNWIGREVGDRELMKELQDLVQSNAPLHIFVGKILNATGYLTPQEIRTILDVIATFENKSEAEVRKMRADRLMERKKYVAAIYEYEALLDAESAIPMSVNLKGDIYHNLGTAYARMFFFDEAAVCFEKAYLANHRVPSLSSLLLCCRILEDDGRFEDVLKKYHVPQDKADDIDKKLQVYRDNKEVNAFSDHLMAIIRSDRPAEKKEKDFRKRLDVWKTNYSRISEI